MIFFFLLISLAAVNISTASSEKNGNGQQSRRTIRANSGTVIENEILSWSFKTPTHTIVSSSFIEISSGEKTNRGNMMCACKLDGEASPILAGVASLTSVPTSAPPTYGGPSAFRQITQHNVAPPILPTYEAYHVFQPRSYV